MSTLPSRLRALLAVAVAILAFPLASIASADTKTSNAWGEPPPQPGCNTACRQDLERAREASNKYRDVAEALRDGFVPVSECVEGQGVHFINLTRLDDGVLHPAVPEVLLYVPDTETKGVLQLVGIEHVDLDDDGNTDTYDDPFPELYGQRFHGPMKGHDPLQAGPVHNELHVWLWSDHPDEIFAQKNPAVSCGGAAPPDATPFETSAPHPAHRGSVRYGRHSRCAAPGTAHVTKRPLNEPTARCVDPPSVSGGLLISARAERIPSFAPSPQAST